MSRDDYITDTDSKYSENKAERGTCLTIMQGTTYNGSGVTFELNEANTNGGAVFSTTESTFICSSCTFTNNKAQNAGAVYADGASRILISSSNFDRNIATDNGSVIYIIMSKTEPISYIKKSTLTNNQVGSFGSIFLNEASLELDEITLQHNMTLKQTSGLFISMSQITLSNSSFINNFGGHEGGCIYASQNSVAKIDNCTIDNVEVVEKGGFLYSITSEIHMSKCTVNNVKAN